MKRLLQILCLFVALPTMAATVTNLNFIEQAGIKIRSTNNTGAGSIDVAVSNTVASTSMLNLSANPYVAFTNVLTKTTTVVSGAGDGSTNYLLTLSTNALNDFYLGSSNVHIYTVAGSTLGSPIYWNAVVTNLSASTWGINFASGTNRWKFSGVYGTNAPSVLTNNTALMLSGRTDGSNNLVGYTYFTPGL